MTIRLPHRAVAHAYPDCGYVRGKAVVEPLVAPAWDEVCERCRRRQQRQRDADRAARAAAVREAAREDVRLRPDAVIEAVVTMSRRGANA